MGPEGIWRSRDVTCPLRSHMEARYCPLQQVGTKDIFFLKTSHQTMHQTYMNFHTNDATHHGKIFLFTFVPRYILVWSTYSRHNLHSSLDSSVCSVMNPSRNYTAIKIRHILQGCRDLK